MWPAASQPPPAKPYRILLTNDDGVRAPGLSAMAGALKSLGDVTIVAPAENQSGKGHSITITDPIYLDRVTMPDGIEASALVATPASCVKVALGGLLAEPPDLVVSGINRDYNLGMTAYVSGTVGAAREAALHGIPAIATSASGLVHPNYEPAARLTLKVAEMVKAHGLERGVFLNVNVPAGPVEAIKGFRVTRQSRSGGTERFEARRTPRGRQYFWNLYEEPKEADDSTDAWAVEHGYVAITPLRVGEFDEKAFEVWKKLKIDD